MGNTRAEVDADYRRGICYLKQQGYKLKRIIRIAKEMQEEEMMSCDDLAAKEDK